jgi:hypothetical protein
MLAAVAATMIGLGQTAAAQAPPEDEAHALAVARELYEAGVRAAEAARWTEAADAFARSHQLAPTTPALANLVTAQIALGRFVQARDGAHALLADPDLPSSHRAWAERMATRASAQVATIVVAGLEAFGDARIALDGRDVASPRLDRPDEVDLEVDPGAHTVSIESARHPERLYRVELAAGETRRLHVLPPASPDPPRSEATSNSDTTSIFAEPLFWVLAGAGAAVIAAVAVVIVLVTQPAPDERLVPRTEIVFQL